MALRNAFENLATEAKQSTIITHVDGIESLLTTIDADTSILSVTGGGVETGALRVTIANNSTGVLSIDDNGGSITVDGTFWQATQPVSGPLTDTQLRATAVPVSLASVPSHAVTNAGTFAVQVSSALPSGTNNIGDVDVLSLPTLANVTTVGTVTTVGAVTSITNALPAGTNAIGKLVANSGVDIGDVDILSIIPGTGATNLGKAVDSVGGATDTGIAVLTLRDDALAAVSPADGDYARMRSDSTGRLWVSAKVDSALPAGTNNIGDVDVLTLPSIPAGANTIGNVNAIQSGTWTVQPGNTVNTTPWLVKPAESLGTATALGALNAEITQALNGNLGSAITVTAISTPTGIVLTPYASYDGGTNWAVSQFFNSANGSAVNTISTFVVGDAYSISAGDGATHIKVKATSWTSGSVTVKLSSSNSQGLVNLKATSVHDDVAGLFLLQCGAVGSATAPTAVSANGDAVRLWATTSGALNIADGGGTITVDGTITTVSAVTAITNALPAGTNNIGDVDVLSIVPGTGATNLGKAVDSTAGATDSGVLAVVIRDDALTTLTPVDNDYTQLRVNSVGRLWTSTTIDAALPTGANAIGSITNTSFAISGSLPAGNNNIGDVDIASALPAGANTIGAVNIAAAQTLATVTTVGTVTTCNLASDDIHDAAAGTSLVLGGGYAYGVTNTDNTLPVINANADAVRFLTNKNGGQIVVHLPEACQAYAPINVTTTDYANSLLVKSTPGTLYMVTGYNSKITEQFIQIHDAASLPIDDISSIPKVIFLVQGKSNFSYDLGNYGRYFTTGIVICNSSVGPYKTIGAADCWIDVQFK